MNKMCIRCGVEKPANEFHATPRGYLRNICKSCMRTAERERRAAQREQMGEEAFNAHRREIARRSRVRRRTALREGQIISVPHGVWSTYSNYGCRCVQCTAANTARARQIRGDGS